MCVCVKTCFFRRMPETQRKRWASQVAPVVKNPPANTGDIRDVDASSGREGPLKKETAAHSKILARRNPWTEEPGGLQSIGITKSWTRLKRFNTKRHTLALNI